MMSSKKHKCQECGSSKDEHGNLHLHVEIENLKQRLLEKERHIVNMETNFLKEADKFPNGEYAALTDELLTWQEKYARLYDAHKRIQKVNQNLEDKLLKIVDKCETEKSVLSNEIASLTRKLLDEQYNSNKLNDENERYRNDLNLAIQLLQCKPSNFIPQKYDSLPSELQAKVKSYVNSKQQRRVDGNGNMNQQPKHEMKTIKVPIPTFPPTAMVYSLNKTTPEKDFLEENDNSPPQVDIVSAAIMAKVLEEREKERLTTKHCQSCSCINNSIHLIHKTTQTEDNIARVKSPSSSSLSSRDGLLISLHSEENTPSSTPTSSKKSLKLVHHHINNINNTNPHEPSTDLINLSFEDNTSGSDIQSSTSGGTGAPISGPRHCSVRMQVGSNNILLDNASEFCSPVVYKSRSERSGIGFPTIEVHGGSHNVTFSNTNNWSSSSCSSGDESFSNLVSERNTRIGTETSI